MSGCGHRIVYGGLCMSVELQSAAMQVVHQAEMLPCALYVHKPYKRQNAG